MCVQKLAHWRKEIDALTHPKLAFAVAQIVSIYTERQEIRAQATHAFVKSFTIQNVKPAISKRCTLEQKILPFEIGEPDELEDYSDDSEQDIVYYR